MFYVIFLGKLEIFFIREINASNPNQNINKDEFDEIKLFISLVIEYKGWSVALQLAAVLNCLLYANFYDDNILLANW